MYDKVFISYAKEDFIFAEKLYDFLRKNGYKPWLDKKSILPGQLWSNEIRKALREASYVVLLLSDVSVEKRGYVQKEFKLAIQYFEEKLDDDIYIVPLKIDNCEIPDTLNKFQWVEYSNSECFNRVLNSLSSQRHKYEEYERKKIASKEIFAYKEVFKEYEYGDKIKFNIKSNVVLFIDESNEGLKEVNAIVQGRNIEKIVSYRNSFIELNGNTIIDDYNSLNWFFEIHYGVNQITNKIISINENTTSFTGGAHGNGDMIKGLNYFLNPTFLIELENLVEYEDKEKILSFFSDYCYNELRKRYNEWVKPTEQELSDQTKDTLFNKDSLSPKWANFKNYLISKNGIEIIFNSYQVSGYAFGLHIVIIPYSEILNILAKPDKIIELINRVK